MLVTGGAGFIGSSACEIYGLALTGLGITTTSESSLEPLRPGDLSASRLDTSLTRNALGWQPLVTVQDGIPSTVRALLAG